MDITPYIKNIIIHDKGGKFSKLPPECINIICGYMNDVCRMPYKQYKNELWPGNPKRELNMEFSQEMWRRRNYIEFILRNNLSCWHSPTEQNTTLTEWNPCGVTVYSKAYTIFTYYPWRAGEWPHPAGEIGEWVYEYFPPDGRGGRYIKVPMWFALDKILRSSNPDELILEILSLEYIICRDFANKHNIKKMQRIRKSNDKTITKLKENNT